jgi:WXG100 family type VII secretion target
VSTDPHVLVSIAALEEAASDASRVASDIVRQLDDLRGYLAPLAATWSGQAANDYQLLQQRWDASATDIEQVLQEVGQRLATAAEQYRQTGQGIKSLWT